MWQIWLIASGVFFIIEIFTVLTNNIIIQTAVFVISSGILIFATKPLVNKLTKTETVPTNVYSVVGKKGIVIEDINYSTGTGQIKSEGEVWSAKTNEQINIPKGTEIEIESIDGVKVIVKPLNTINNSY